MFFAEGGVSGEIKKPPRGGWRAPRVGPGGATGSISGEIKVTDKPEKPPPEEPPTPADEPPTTRKADAPKRPSPKKSSTSTSKSSHAPAHDVAAKAPKTKASKAAPHEGATEPGSRGKGKSTSQSDVEPTHESSHPTKLTPEVVHKGTSTLTRLVTRFSSDLMSSAREHVQDKDVADMLKTVDNVIDVHSMLSDPKGFTAQTIKNELIGGVFKHFSRSLWSDENKYVTRFPEPAEFQKDPLGLGVSLEQFRTQYEEARATYMAGRVDREKQFIVLEYYLEHSHLTRLQQTELIKKTLAGLANIPELEHRFHTAKLLYAGAVTAVNNSLNDVRADLAAQRKDFPQDLRRRGHALGGVAQTCQDFSDELRYFAVFPPAEAASYDFHQLADGFAEIADEFDSFASLVEGRKGLYDREAERIEAEGKGLASDKD